MRLAHITGSPPNPSHFAVLVRSIPWSPEQSYSDLVKQFFINYHASSYLSHQMVSDSWTVHKLVVRIIPEYFRILLPSYYIFFFAWLDLLCCYSVNYLPASVHFVHGIFRKLWSFELI